MFANPEIDTAMRLILTTMLLVAAMIAAPGAHAGEPSQSSAITIAQSGGKSLNEAVQQVRRQCNGRIVDAKTRVQGNREVHHIKCLTKDGKVRTFTVNGKQRGNRA